MFIPILSPILTQLNARWSQLKSFLRRFAPTTTAMIDKIIAVALDLMNPQHLRNWESSLLLLYLVTAVTAVFGRSGDRHKTLPPFGGIFDESIISSLGNLGRYFRTFFPPLMIQNIKNMQKTNATDNILKIVTFTPSQPFGADPQKPQTKSKGNVT